MTAKGIAHGQHRGHFHLCRILSDEHHEDNGHGQRDQHPVPHIPIEHNLFTHLARSEMIRVFFGTFGGTGNDEQQKDYEDYTNFP